MDETKIARKLLKKDGRQSGLSLLLYLLVSTIVSVAVMLPLMIINIDYDYTMGITSFIGAIISCLAVYLFFCMKDSTKRVFVTSKKLSFPAFLIVLCFFIAASAIAYYIYEGIVLLLNQIGLQYDTSALEEQLGSNNIFMLLSVCVLAPVGEELIFRGFLIRHLEKYGKRDAIIITALLFALLHGNLAQGINAFLLGLVLGYVALEHNIIWCILLHAVNNFVLCTLLPSLLGGWQYYGAAYFWLEILCIVVSVITLIVKRNEVKTWLVENFKEKTKIGALMLTIWTVIFTLINVITALLFIKPL